MTPLEQALAFTRSEEGGISNDPHDHGGFTVSGYTQTLYDSWRAKQGLGLQSVTLITESEKVEIARDEFWEPCRCDELHPALAMAVFDMAFNSSPAQAIRTLQRALGFPEVDVDGRMGPHTLGAAQETRPAVLVLAFIKKRGKFLQSIVRADPTQVAELGGWIARLVDQAWALSRDTAV